MFKIYQVFDLGMDGRDSRSIGFFATRELADKEAEGRGAMGNGPGSVSEIEVKEAHDCDIEAKRAAALAKLTAEERALLGL